MKSKVLLSALFRIPLRSVSRWRKKFSLLVEPPPFLIFFRPLFSALVDFSRRDVANGGGRRKEAKSKSHRSELFLHPFATPQESGRLFRIVLGFAFSPLAMWNFHFSAPPLAIFLAILANFFCASCFLSLPLGRGKRNSLVFLVLPSPFVVTHFGLPPFMHFCSTLASEDESPEGMAELLRGGRYFRREAFSRVSESDPSLSLSSAKRAL